MTGLEYILLAAFVAVVAITVWFARLTIKITSWLRILWEKHDMLLSAAQDLDLQVSELTHAIKSMDTDKALRESAYSRLLELLDDADADMAWMSALISERDSDITLWLGVAEDSKKEIGELRETIARNNIDIANLDADYEALGNQLESVMKNHTLTPICHSCKRRMKKDSVLVNGVYTCDWCKGKTAKAEEAPNVEPELPSIGTWDTAMQEMKLGRSVFNANYHGGIARLRIVDNRIQIWARNKFEDLCAIESKFMPPNRLSEGWEIYVEPAKPLLANAKVGDIVATWREMKYLQIEVIEDGLVVCEGIKYDLDGNPVRWNRTHYVPMHGHTQKIESVQSIAPEGTAEWAWQMLLLSHKVAGRVGIYEREGDMIYVISNGERYPLGTEVCEWLNMMKKTSGWQLYKESDK